MTTKNRNKLNFLYHHLPAGTPITSQELASMDISSDLAVHYVRAGWLHRLAYGVYARAGEELILYPCLTMLQKRINGLHVGGKSALDWYGIRQYVTQQELLQLYGHDAAHLPEWFTQRFPSEYHRKRLFNEPSNERIGINHFNQQDNAPQVSSPERALLELLSDVGVRQPLQEAAEITESTYSLRADVLQSLLKCCTNIKTVRLCLHLGKELSLPWIQQLDTASLPVGSNKPWVSKTKDGIWVLK